MSSLLCNCQTIESSIVALIVRPIIASKRNYINRQSGKYDKTRQARLTRTFPKRVAFAEELVTLRIVACVLDSFHHIREVRGTSPEVAAALLGQHCLEAIAEADRSTAWHHLQRLSLCGPPVEIVVRSVFGQTWRVLLMQLTEARVVVIGMQEPLASSRRALSTA